MKRPIHEFFTKDHRRIDALLEHAIKDRSNIEEDIYHQFRVGLLTHIKMEEKILFKAAKLANKGKPIPTLKTLRLEHGALTALVTAPPTPELIKVLIHINEVHDEREEKPGGMYDLCEELTSGQLELLMEQLKATTPVPVHPPNPSKFVLGAVKRAVERAGYDYDEISGKEDRK